MTPLTRREALLLGTLGVGGTVIGATGLVWATSTAFPATGGEPLTEPRALRSENGRLSVQLDAAEGPLRIAGRDATASGFNGSVPGPTLYLRQGDRLEIRLTNGLSKATNLHVHGLHVSPQGNGDNVLLTIEPGQSFDYAYDLRADHPPGTYWYHPHLHGSVADQVFAGLYGAIVVEEPQSIPVTRERILVISDITLDASGRVKVVSAGDRMMGREGESVLVNGQTRPRLSARPGERERWRVVNACAARYLQLSLAGQTLQLLAKDSGSFATPRDVADVVLAPGNRADLLVTTVQGSASLITAVVDRGGMMGGMMGGSMGGSASTGPTTIATLEVGGGAVTPLPDIASRPAARDLRGLPIARRRTITFAMGMGTGQGMGGGMAFTLDGKKFDATRVDQTMSMNTVEEWTIANTSPMDHPFHLHVWTMQLVEAAGIDLTEPAWQDVVNVPALGQVKVLLSFDDFGGRTVYHCHILDHEDVGMMGLVEAV